MQASETKFQPIIEGTKQYVVPLFQRPYSWDKKEWQVLWDDLVWLCENDEPKNHFIGSIVTIPTASVPEGIPKYLLIDGQQRLTTIFILLAVLRDIAADESEDLAHEIEQTLLVNPFKRGDDYFRLMPTQVDRESYRKLIRHEKIDDDSRLLQAYQFFERKLKQGSISINDLVRVISSRLSIVSIVLGQDDNAHLVFESLNAKGRPLTQSDLIRNYFFMRIHVDQQEQINATYWEPMQVALGENLTECIRHYLMRNGSIVKQTDVYFTLKERVGQSSALEELERINRFAGYYERLVNPEREPHLQIAYVLSRLKRFEVTTTYPFLLNCYEDYAQKRLSDVEFLSILQSIENFIVRRWVCNYATSALNKIFPALYQQAKHQQQSRSFVEGVKLALVSRGYPRDTEFSKKLLDAKLYGNGERREKTKLLLEALEASHGHRESPDFDILTIEHVMPQTCNEWWKSHLGEDWEGDHELFVDTLGNLTLTAYNSELSNRPFPDKQVYYGESHIELNRYFGAMSSWDRSSIETRSQALTQLAIHVWPFLGNPDTQSVDANSIRGSRPRSVLVFGQRFDVESWRDVLEITWNVLAELEPDKFDRLVQTYDRFLSRDASRLRSSRRLKNGFFFEVNLSSTDIYRLCTQTIEVVGLTSDDWSVEIER